MIYAAQIYLLLCILFLAGKDATSYRLKDHNSPASSLQDSRIKRWHRDGAALWVLVTLPVAWFISPWLALYSILLRGALFDPWFNKWAGLRVGYLGGSAWFDRLFKKVFGDYGALKKSIVFLILIGVLNFLI